MKWPDVKAENTTLNSSAGQSQIFGNLSKMLNLMQLVFDSDKKIIII